MRERNNSHRSVSAKKRKKLKKSYNFLGAVGSGDGELYENFRSSREVLEPPPPLAKSGGMSVVSKPI